MFFKLQFNPSHKLHLVIGLSIALWIYLFLVFVGPYDVSPLSFGWRAKIMVGYSIRFMLCYAATTFLQNLIFKKVKIWNVWLELIAASILFVIFLPSSFWYYKSQWILGEASFYTYAPNMYLPTLPLVVPLLFLGRWIAAKWVVKEENAEEEHFVITGENKLDVLRVCLPNLIAVEAANNYVVVYYLNGNKLHKKLIRTTLTKIKEQIPDLIKTHRSFLINASHFIKWVDGKNIELFHMQVPVSRRYKAIVKAGIAANP